MNIKMIDGIELINHALTQTLEIYKDYIGTGAFKSVKININDIQSDLNHHLMSLSAWAFKSNTKILLVNGTSPFHNILINAKELNHIPNSHLFCLIDQDFRELYKQAKIFLPTSNDISRLHIKLMENKIFKNIYPVSLKLDSKTTMKELNKLSPIDDIEEIELDEIFTTEVSEEQVVIDPYTFYNKISDIPISYEIKDQHESYIKTQAELMFNSVFN